MDSPPTSDKIIEFFVWRSGDRWWALHKRPGGHLIHADSFPRLELKAMVARIGYDMRLAGQSDRRVSPVHRVGEAVRREERDTTGLWRGAPSGEPATFLAGERGLPPEGV